MDKKKIVSRANRVLDRALTVSSLERTIAFGIDMLGVACVLFLPPLGLVLGLAYFFFRDTLPLGIVSSFGKSIYDLKVVIVDDGVVRRIPWHKSVVRCLVMLIPILNLVDAYRFFRYGERLVDKWLGSRVIKRTE